MGLTVPTFTDPMNQVHPQQLPGVRVSTQAPADAFGAGPSNEKLSQAEMGAGKAVVDYFQEERNRADQVAHIAADTEASKLQTQIQVQVGQMKGKDAFGAQDYMEQAWQDGTSKIRDNLQGRNQQFAFDRSASQRYQELNRNTQLHMMQQSEAFDDQTTQSGIDQARNAAIVNAGDPAQVSQNVDLTKQLVDGWAKRKGVPVDSDVYKEKLTQELSATHMGVIQARLEAGLDDSAKEYFKNNKTQMAATDVIHAQNALENSEVIGQSTEIWDDIQDKKGFKFSDGSINGEAVRKYVMDNSDDMSDQKKLKVLSQVKAMTNEYNRDRYRQVAANERDFANEVVQARQNGMPLNDALNIAHKWGYDSYDMAQKTAFIQSTYAPPKETKTIAHEQLREGIQSGTVDLSDIDRAFNQGQVNAEDYANLRQLKLKTATDGTDPQMKYTDNLIKGLAAKAIGNDKEAQAQFQYVLNQKAQGRTADEKLAIAQDELKKVPPPDAHFWNSNVFKFKNDAPQIEGESTANGQILEDVGFKQIQAINQGLGGNPYTRDTNPAAHVQAFANSLGLKYDDLKQGQPANNAIRSLQSKGRLVTPEAVQRVLKKHPDGNWQ